MRQHGAELYMYTKLQYGVRLSQHVPTAANPLLQVCCCEPGGRAGDVDRLRCAAGECSHVVSERKRCPSACMSVCLPQADIGNESVPIQSAQCWFRHLQ